MTPAEALAHEAALDAIPLDKLLRDVTSLRLTRMADRRTQVVCRLHGKGQCCILQAADESIGDTVIRAVKWSGMGQEEWELEAARFSGAGSATVSDDYPPEQCQKCGGHLHHADPAGHRCP